MSAIAGDEKVMAKEPFTCPLAIPMAVSKDFQRLYSIELSEDLFQRARNRFVTKKHVTILQGDSGEVVRKLMPAIKERTLFWLDGHYSAGETAKADKLTPIFEELGAILSISEFGHVILIDDAREFTGENDYPTLQELKAFVLNLQPESVVTVKDDIIRIVGKTQGNPERE